MPRALIDDEMLNAARRQPPLRAADAFRHLSLAFFDLLE